MEGHKRQKGSRCCKYKVHEDCQKMGAELVVYDNVTNDVYMQDLINGRTDVIVNDYYLQKMAIATIKDKYPVKINDGNYSNPYSTSLTFSSKNKTLQEKVNKAIKDRKEDGTLTKISEKFFADQDVTKKTKVDYTEIDISDVE